MEPLPLLRGTITLSQALEDECNTLQRLSYPAKRREFYMHLLDHARDIEAIVSHHLGVPKNVCQTPPINEWIHGSFNICIPMIVHGNNSIIIRFPLPYKVAEATNPGNAEEKLRCEVATYAWMQSHCPTVPIPRLRGFQFPGKPSFTALSQAPLLSRLAWYIRQSIRWILGRSAASAYVAHSHHQKFNSGYIVIDHVNKGRMLSATWDTIHNNANKRRALYQDISRLMLSLAEVEFPRIGSLTMDDYGVVSLANRPLGLHLVQLENEEIPTDIPRELTYATTDTYLLDRLLCHDNRIRYQPNSITDQADGESQLSTLTIMRALVPNFTRRERREGPFILMLTDLHSSNIFVDNDGHVTCVIDLEWSCTLPSEMLQPPHWLTNRAIDELTDDYLTEYRERQEEFISAFAAEEEASGGTTSYAEAMEHSWRTGGFWYFNAIDSQSGLYNLFLQHIQPAYGSKAIIESENLERSAAPYWTSGTTEFMYSKLEQRQKYLHQLRDFFDRASR